MIDVHTHVVPSGFPANPSPDTNVRWPCMCLHGADKGTIEIAGKAFRELDSRSWDPTRRLDDMARDGVSAQVLSPMPELLSYWFSPRDALELGRHVNAAIAGLVDAAPDNFHSLGTVPLQDVELAATELTRLHAEGFRGVEIGSNINGDYLGEPRFDEFWAEAERLDLCIFVHALHPVGADRLTKTPQLVPFGAFPLDTGLSALTLIHAGVPQRFPSLRFGFSHGGGAITPLVHRMHQGWQLMDSVRGELEHPPAHYAAKFFYDSLVYDTGWLDYLASEFAPGQFFAGTDYPYVIQQPDPVGFLSATRHCQVEAANVAARRFLGIDAN